MPVDIKVPKSMQCKQLDKERRGKEHALSYKGDQCYLIFGYGNKDVL